MNDITINKENLKIAMEKALTLGANIEVIPKVMEESYPIGLSELCYSVKINFMVHKKIIELEKDGSMVHIPPISYRGKEVVTPELLSKAMIKDEALRKEFLTIFTQILKELKNA